MLFLAVFLRFSYGALILMRCLRFVYHSFILRVSFVQDSVWFRCKVYGVQCMVYGVWCMVYGVWCMVYGVLMCDV